MMLCHVTLCHGISRKVTACDAKPLKKLLPWARLTVLREAGRVAYASFSVNIVLFRTKHEPPFLKSQILQ